MTWSLRQGLRDQVDPGVCTARQQACAPMAQLVELKGLGAARAADL